MNPKTVDPKVAPQTIAHRYRRFLLVFSAFLFGGTVVELLLTEHMESVVQVLPFVLCGLGFGAVIAALLVPKRSTLLGLRVVMGIAALGGLFGIYEHFAHNLAFELDIRPNATTADVFGEALRGASPMLAPGILAVAAILAAAATYYHPALMASPDE